MKRSILFTMILVFVFGLPINCIAGEEIRIGVMTTLTGEAAYIGEYAQDGANMAVKEINDNGGINGSLVKLYYEDETTTTASINAYRKLRERKVHAIVGSIYSVKVAAVLPEVQKFGGPPIVVGATSPKIWSKETENDWVFGDRASDELVTKLAVKFAVEELNADKVGIIYINDDFGRDGLEAMKALFETRNMEPAAITSCVEGDKDFTAQIRLFKQVGCEVIIPWVHPLEGGLFVRQLHQLGMDVDIVGPSHFVSVQTMEIMGKDADEGLYSVTDFVASSEEPKVAEWVAEYIKLYDREPALFSVFAYDAVNILAAAIEKAGTADPEDIRDALLEIEVEGIIGTFKANPETLNGLHQVRIAQIQNGKPVVLQTIKE